jgi:hypothetical protein
MNRCIAININNKKCRAKTDKLFCCEDHKPINKELINNGCFMCMEKINKTNEIIFFKCKHAFHKICYMEWLKYSSYETPICIICRKEVMIGNKYTNQNKKLMTNDHMELIFSLLNNKESYYKNNFYFTEGINY